MQPSFVSVTTLKVISCAQRVVPLHSRQLLRHVAFAPMRYYQPLPDRRFDVPLPCLNHAVAGPGCNLLKPRAELIRLQMLRRIWPCPARLARRDCAEHSARIRVVIRVLVQKRKPSGSAVKPFGSRLFLLITMNSEGPTRDQELY